VRGSSRVAAIFAAICCVLERLDIHSFVPLPRSVGRLHSPREDTTPNPRDRQAVLSISGLEDLLLSDADGTI